MSATGNQKQYRVDLSNYRQADFDRGASFLRESAWQIVSLVFFRVLPIRAHRLKRWLLKLFGARVGRGTIIKPGVKITFPWRLALGDNVWLGEDCWILNLAPVSIAGNVCISQRAFICTGNHNYRDPAFSLITEPVTIDDGAWIGAGAFVAPGVKIGRNAVLEAFSTATSDLRPDTVYRGIPATAVRQRWGKTDSSLEELVDAAQP